MLENPSSMGLPVAPAGAPCRRAPADRAAERVGPADLRELRVAPELASSNKAPGFTRGLLLARIRMRI